MSVEEYECRSCKCYFDESDYDGIDDEVNEYKPMCPDCQQKERIKGKICEYCDSPAVTEAGDLFLCEDHYDDYVDGYIRED